MEFMGKQLWSEDPAAADDYRQRYVDGLASFVARKNAENKLHRTTAMSPEALKADPEFFRQKYKKMLGLDLFAGPSPKPTEVTYVDSDEVCDIYRLTVYITEEIPFYAMLLLPRNGKKPMPLVIAQHGGNGTPELCSDYHGANNYNHMVQRALAKGRAVLAPQILVWCQTEGERMRAHPIPYDRKKLDVDLKRFGSSITALEISGIMKSLDYVCAREDIDPEQVSMIGISYGGYFTLHTMAADRRIKAGYCAAVFNDRDVYNWSDWTYQGSATMFQDAEVAALCAPRKLYVQVGKTDPVFDYHSALPEAERVKAYFEAFSVPENYIFDLWDGGHTITDHDKGYEFIFG